MGLTEYECPACGGAMEFDAKSQMLSCPYCDTQIKVGDYKAPRQEEQDKDAKADSNEWRSEELNGMVVYSCQSCGGEIIASETEGSLTCPFCSNNVVVKEKFAGDLRPNYVIPFKTTKEDAMKAYSGYVKNKLLLPSAFFEQNHIHASDWSSLYQIKPQSTTTHLLSSPDLLHSGFLPAAFGYGKIPPNQP